MCSISNAPTVARTLPHPCLSFYTVTSHLLELWGSCVSFCRVGGAPAAYLLVRPQSRCLETFCGSFDKLWHTSFMIERKHMVSPFPRKLCALRHSASDDVMRLEVLGRITIILDSYKLPLISWRGEERYIAIGPSSVCMNSSCTASPQIHDCPPCQHPMAPTFGRKKPCNCRTQIKSSTNSILRSPII
jgi:hypothetical protein